MIVGPKAEFVAVICADNYMLPAACCSLFSMRNNFSGLAPVRRVSLDPDVALLRGKWAKGLRKEGRISACLERNRLPASQK